MILSDRCRVGAESWDSVLVSSSTCHDVVVGSGDVAAVVAAGETFAFADVVFVVVVVAFGVAEKLPSPLLAAVA